MIKIEILDNNDEVLEWVKTKNLEVAEMWLSHPDRVKLINKLSSDVTEF